MDKIIRYLGPWGWAIVAIAFGLILWLIVWFMGAPVREATARQEGRIAAEQADAATDKGRQSIEEAGKAARDNTATQDLRRTNEQDIRAAEGAGDGVNPGAAGAGRRSLCKYAAYRDRPECVQLARPK